MDVLWSPWRYKYIRDNTEGGGAKRECIFCTAHRALDPASMLVLGRSARTYAILNLYPYTSGHLMIVPYEHVASLAEVESDTTAEMMEQAKRAQRALEAVYQPDGFNIGINLGRAAGAGIAEHLHLHVVPRWIGDANFMTIVGETRVMPETLEVTYAKLAPFFEGGGRREEGGGGREEGGGRREEGGG
jgi:ATP adenylyltransferase